MRYSASTLEQDYYIPPHCHMVIERGDIQFGLMGADSIQFTISLDALTFPEPPPCFFYWRYLPTSALPVPLQPIAP
jgi:hypothetical protein